MPKSTFQRWFEAQFGRRPKIPAGLPASNDVELMELAAQGDKARQALKERSDYDAWQEIAKKTWLTRPYSEDKISHALTNLRRDTELNIPPV